MVYSLNWFYYAIALTFPVIQLDYTKYKKCAKVFSVWLLKKYLFYNVGNSPLVKNRAVTTHIVENLITTSTCLNLDFVGHSLSVLTTQLNFVNMADTTIYYANESAGCVLIKFIYGH